MGDFLDSSTDRRGHAETIWATDDFRLREDIYPAGLSQPRHSHRLASFSFVSSGNYREAVGRKTYARQGPTVILHPPEESHAVLYESPVKILSVHFSFNKLADIRRRSTVLDSPSSCRSETVSWLGARLRQELRRIDAISALEIEGLILEMLAEASRAGTHGGEKDSPKWLEVAKDFLHDNFAESFTLTQVAKIAGVHPAHLSRVFRQRVHSTVGEYVRRLRVESACRQILNTDRPLSQIAAHAGFADQSHFNKVFKSRFNLTPNEYRQLYRRR